MSRCSRRRFIRGSLGLGLLSGCGLPLAPWTATPGIPRIAVVHGRSPAASAPYTEAFRQGLWEYGYEEGRNIALELHFLDGTAERSTELARELAVSGVAAIVTGNPQFVVAAKEATETVPIVLAGALNDPVGAGVAASFNRPGGNVTGLTFARPEQGPKRLQLLKEAAPAIRRFGTLWDGTIGPSIAPRVKEQEEAGASLGLEMHHYWLRRPEELEPAFDAMQRDGIDSLNVPATGLTTRLAGPIVELAAQHRLPATYAVKDFTDAGGLMMLAVDQFELFRRAAGYLHRILQGANPAELPIEQPSKFEFIINLKAARALGLTIPPEVLTQATEVIQ